MEPITPSPKSAQVERPLGAHRLGQYVARNRCERYLRLTLCPSEAGALKERYRVSFETLSPILSEEGQSFERGRLAELRASGERVVDLRNRGAADLVAELRAQPAGRTFYYQPGLEGEVGGCPCGGRADLIEVTRGEGGALDALVIDIKASQRETVGHRLQVALYARLLRDALGAAGLRVASVGGAVAARDAEFAPGAWAEFDLGLFADEVERLVGAADSDAARAAATTFEQAGYHLGRHCDGCPYNALCFINAAERQDLSLVPHLTPTEKAALLAEGITSVRELADLMRYAERGLEPAPGREAAAAAAGRRWPLGSRLPVLVQRARAAVRRHDRTVEARRTLYGADWGSLPDHGQHPDLVRVFVEAGRDHIQDRLYLLGGLVVGPAGTTEIVELAGGPPDLDAERELIVGWLRRVLPAVRRAADSPEAPLHLYLFDRRGQRSLLDALTRHFDSLCAVPAFYDLLTSTPALTQAMVSFVGDEVRERLNLGPVCQNLYEVAQALDFDWRDGEADVTAVFRSRVFDNRRPYVRDAGTGLFRAADGGGAGAVWVESAARFGTEIPLEYAYAAWGVLREAEELTPEARAQLRGFLGTRLEDIRGLAAQRLRALRHVEESFRYKNKRVEKQALDLSRLDEVETDPADVPLSLSVEHFLYLEHHARMQELLLHLSLPPEARAETGRTAVLRCDGFEKAAGSARAVFTVSDEAGSPAPASAAAALRLREGDWVVLNPLEDEDGGPLLGKRLVHGRLCVVEEVGAGRVALKLQSMSFAKSEFRFKHRALEPEPGRVYTTDEMADDFNADKFLEACRNAETNHLYQWLHDPAAGQAPREHIRPSRLRAAEHCAGLADRAQAPRGLTAAQSRVIGGRLTDRLFLLQGPPGTGKSHTLGFALLARALALATPARPFRAAVVTRTHAAAEVALASVRRRADQLLGAFPGEPAVAGLASLRVMKVCHDAAEALPAGVEALLAEGSGGVKGPEQWARLAAAPLLVVGGTPGGLYNLIKRGPTKGSRIAWEQKHFDLVIVDEASQMGLAEALTAAAWLREDGQFVAVGDHRQMPPILAHAWDEEHRRDLRRARPHLSVFDYMRALGFAGEGLDESFRIPAEIASFLGRHIYAADGIAFRSENRARLATAPGLGGWAGAALAPEHPAVVVEHSEAGSQQSNEFEAALVEELVRAAGLLALDPAEGVGVVVPHRAQKFLLRARLPGLADSIDTVERFQGGERDLIIVSATVSDREFARAESGFLLDPRRLTVAVSRPKRKLVVVASRAVFDLIPADLDEYERGGLWKYLRRECGARPLWEGEVGAHRVRVYAVGDAAASAPE